MDIKQLRSFVAIVDYQGFSRAAEKLNISQATVSTHLLQLEKELAVKLIYRTTQSVEITEAGRKVYKYASQILEMERYVIDICSAGARRIIRIGASTIPAAYILPNLLQQYGDLFTNDRLKVSQVSSKEAVAGIQAGRFDVGLVGHPVETEGIQCVPLYPNPMVLITPVTEQYLRMQQHRTPVTELLKEPIILREKGSRKSLDLFLDKMGLEERDLRVVARVNDQETVKNMVAGGMGVSVISEIAAKDFVQSRRLLKFDLPKFQDRGYVCLIYPDSYTPKDTAWNFIDYLRESGRHPSGSVHI